MSFVTIKGYRLACRWKPGGSPSIVFVHGLGAAKNSFDPFFEDQAFGCYALASMDLPGCGDSDHQENFSYTMRDQADLVLEWIRGLGLTKIILVGHSMGSVICLHLAESLPAEVIGFLNLEGNLGYEDCTFSKHAAAMDLQDFEGRGYGEYKTRLAESLNRTSSPGLFNYYENISRTYPKGLYLSSLSLVQESRHGDLKERFQRLSMKKWYVFGSLSLNPESEAYLQKHQIPYYVVPQSGHFMMDDQPGMFREILVNTAKTLSFPL